VTEWDGSLSVAAIGREKANAYIAAVEEVGLVGTVPLVLGLIGALLIGFRSARRAKSRGDGTPAALVALISAGALHTNFEAWLTSIGSYEGFIFWATMGVLLMNAQRSASRSMDAGG
jgi:O-antigen ligase